MIGQFRFRIQNQKHLARLSDALAWTCDERDIEAFLNATHGGCPPDADPWEVGRRLLFSAAARFNGHVEPTP